MFNFYSIDHKRPRSVSSTEHCQGIKSMLPTPHICFSILLLNANLDNDEKRLSSCGRKLTKRNHPPSNNE